MNRGNELKQSLGDRIGFGETSQEVLSGKVKNWFSEKGFGFIACNKKDYFCHITKVKDKKELNPGDTVEFKIVNSVKGVQAIDVEVVRELSDIPLQ